MRKESYIGTSSSSLLYRSILLWYDRGGLDLGRSSVAGKDRSERIREARIVRGTHTSYGTYSKTFGRTYQSWEDRPNASRKQKYLCAIPFLDDRVRTEAS
eukprot:scaffold4510_cov183-Amphora_coffeaeformis.AAC.84